MKHLIDSDVVVEYLRARPSTLTLIQALNPSGLAVSLITYGEVYEGIYFGHNPPAQEQAFVDFLAGVTILPLDEPIMRQYARLRGQLRRAGTLIGDADTLIAATALYHNLTLVTGNVQHFNRVPGLVLLASPGSPAA